MKISYKKRDSFSVIFDIFMAGIIAPNTLPRCGTPELCIPVNILAICFLLIKYRKMLP